MLSDLVSDNCLKEPDPQKQQQQFKQECAVIETFFGLSQAADIGYIAPFGDDFITLTLHLRDRDIQSNYSKTPNVSGHDSR